MSSMLCWGALNVTSITSADREYTIRNQVQIFSLIKCIEVSEAKTLEYTIRNQVQIFSLIKCIEVSEVTLSIHLAQSLGNSMNLILFTFIQPENFSRA